MFCIPMALLLTLVGHGSAKVWPDRAQNETCSAEDASMLNIATQRRANRKKECTYCVCLTPDPVKCGEKMITSAEKCGTEFVANAEQCGKEWVTDAIACGTDVVTSAVKCGEKQVTSIVDCGESLIESCDTRRRRRWLSVLDVTCDFGHIAKTCLVPKTCSVPKSCWKPKFCWLPKSCLDVVTCWLPQNFLECADVILQELPGPLQPFWLKYVKNYCPNLQDCEQKVKDGVVDVVKDAWQWMEEGFGNYFDGEVGKIIGGIGSFKSMWDKLNIENTVLTVKSELLSWVRKVEDEIGQLSEGPVYLANTADGRLCPAGLGDSKMFGLFPTDCGLFEEFRKLLDPLGAVVTELEDLIVNGREQLFTDVVNKAKECLSFSGPWKWKGVSIPHPFFEIGHFDMCLQKSNVDAVDVVLNLIYKGVKEVTDLFDKITAKVSNWVSKELLSKLGMLTVEQQKSLPPVLAQGAKCIPGTKDWSIKVKLTGKYKFQVLNEGSSEALYWRFGLGAGVVFGCHEEIYRTYPFVDIAHPFALMFTFSRDKIHDKDFKAEGSLALSFKAHFTKFSNIGDSGIKGAINLGVKAGGKNLPWPCPVGTKCGVKKKFSLLKIPSGEFIDLTDTDDILETLVYTQEVELSAKWNDVTSWFRTEGLVQNSADPKVGSKLVLDALRHMAASNISLPSKVESAVQPNSSNFEAQATDEEKPELEFSVGVDASWSLCLGPTKLCS